MNNIVNSDIACIRCENKYTTLVKNEDFISKSCVICGNMEFFDYENREKIDRRKKYYDTLLCEVCEDNRYTKGLIKSNLKICGECYLDKIYEAPGDVISNKNNNYIEKLSKTIKMNLKFFKYLVEEKLEDYIYNKYKEKEFGNIKELIVHCSEKSGISYFIIKNIFIAKKSAEEYNNGHR